MARFCWYPVRRAGEDEGVAYLFELLKYSIRFSLIRDTRLQYLAHSLYVFSEIAFQDGIHRGIVDWYEVSHKV